MQTNYVNPLTGEKISKEEYDALLAAGHEKIGEMAKKAQDDADRRKELIAAVAKKLDLSAEDAVLLFR